MTAAVLFFREQPPLFAAVYSLSMLLAALWGRALFRADDGPDTGQRFLRALLPVAGVTLAFLFAHKVGSAYFNAANWLRLERPFLLAHGYSLYTAPGQGPAVIAIYPPVSAWLLMPVTWLRSLTLIAESAECMTLSVIVLPVAAWHLFFRKGGASGSGFGALFIFLFFPFTTAALRNAFFNVHPDSAALGFGTLAAFLLSREGRGNASLYGSSLAAVLAAWSKQPALTLLWALPLYLVWSGRKKGEARRYSAYLTFNFAVVTGLFIACYGAKELAYFLLEVPSRHPWIEKGGVSALAAAGERLVRASAEIGVLFVAAVWLSKDKESPGGGSRLEGRGSAATLALWLAICYLPAALIGRAKLGGSVNTLSYFSFYLLMAATLCLAASSAKRARALMAGLLFCLVIGHGVSLANKYTLVKRPAPFADTAARVIRAHPGAVYFPRLNALHLIEEGRAYHDSVGLTDLLWAGRPLNERELRAYWPAHLERVAFVADDADDLHWLGLPAAYRRVSDPELPGFIVYKRVA